MDRWHDHVHVRGDRVAEMWRTAARDRRTLFVVGEGFDPRMLLGLRHGIERDCFADLNVISLGLAPPGGVSERAKQAAKNVAELEGLLVDAGATHSRIPCPTVVEKRTLSRPLLKALLDHDLLQTAEHLVIDISALPVGVYFGLIKGLLSRCDEGSLTVELQVCVAENVEIDRRIAGQGVDAPAPILGFSFGTDIETTIERPLLVWAPILGEGAVPQMEAITDWLQPDEICPVLPFPAANPRRADDLLLEMREMLVERLEVEPPNYIYADEGNPFDLYRTLTRLQDRYRSALASLGDVSVVLSVHSSKSLSLGALLAAYEYRMPALNAEPDHYGFAVAPDSTELAARSSLSGTWLFGMPTEGP